MTAFGQVGGGGGSSSFGPDRTTTTTTKEGPRLCVETESTTKLTIDLRVRQEITTSIALFGEKEVYFNIGGYTKVEKKSARSCLPKKVAEDLVESRAFEGCTEIQDQEYTAIGMGGEPPIFAPAGRTGKLFKMTIPKTSRSMSIKKIKPAGVEGTLPHYPGPAGTGPVHAIRKVGPIYELSRPTTWQKVNYFAEFEIFVGGSGNSYHEFFVKITFEKSCPPAICGPCGSLVGAPGFGETTTQGSEVECKDQNPNPVYMPINITETMPLVDWIGIDEGPGGADGYLGFNDPYWSKGPSISPATPYQIALADDPFNVAQGPFTDPANYATTPGTNVLVQGRGPGYARWDGFGEDIFNGRDNPLSQALHSLTEDLKNLFNNDPPGSEDVFCGSHPGDFNINDMLKGFAEQWKNNSSWHDRTSEMRGEN